MGNSSSHTVTVFNYATTDANIELSLAFDGDDAVRSTATNHCNGPGNYGHSCSMSCNHSNCDMRFCSHKYVGQVCQADPGDHIFEIGNVGQKNLLFFYYNDNGYILSDSEPNEEPVGIFNGANSDIRLKASPKKGDGDDGTFPSNFNIGWSTIDDGTSKEFATLSLGYVDVTVDLGGVHFDYTLEQDKCYTFKQVGNFHEGFSMGMVEVPDCVFPTPSPTPNPTPNPTPHPTPNPTPSPTKQPTPLPTSPPTANPTTNPTTNPTAAPTSPPSEPPTLLPSASPSTQPSSSPSNNPTLSASPSGSPSNQPTGFPSSAPSTPPSLFPSGEPSASSSPSSNPTGDCVAEQASEDPCDDSNKVLVCKKKYEKHGSFKYIQECDKKEDIEGKYLGDEVSKDTELASCGCCLFNDEINEDIYSGVEFREEDSADCPVIVRQRRALRGLA